jgi:hypothetical protein
MRYLVPAMLAVCLLAARASSQETGRPQGAPPDLQRATLKDGFITWTYMVTGYKEEIREFDVKTPDGKIKKEQRKVIVPVPETHQAKIDVKEAKVSRADGKVLTADDLGKLLKEPTPIIVSTDFQPIDPYFLQFFKPEAIIVVPPLPKIERPGV